MNCRQLVDFLLDYQEGRLPEATRAVFEEHMARCPPCREYLDGYRATIAVTGRVAEDDCRCEPIPEELVQAILIARRRGCRADPDHGGRP